MILDGWWELKFSSSCSIIFFHLACLCQQKSCWKERERDRFNLGGEKKRNSGDFKCLRRFLPIFSRWITLKPFAELEKNATPNRLRVSGEGVRFTKIFKCCPYIYFQKKFSTATNIFYKLYKYTYLGNLVTSCLRRNSLPPPSTAARRGFLKGGWRKKMLLQRHRCLR